MANMDVQFCNSCNPWLVCRDKPTDFRLVNEHLPKLLHSK